MGTGPRRLRGRARLDGLTIYHPDQMTKRFFNTPLADSAVNHAHSWSTYISDSPRTRTTIVDPMINNGDRPADELRNEHIKIADELRVVLVACIFEYFDGWTPKAKGWQNWFPKAHQRPLGLQQGFKRGYRRYIM
ncbi:uncharacterized protein LOC119294281 [Triticum dicoccoides]|uniref:uncharacterized protein LOC119294281 n=1 Tax=Triticum dicoccoides TaxID=85692 RepID=UPI000E7A7570|nr:uncharacterized protein LOC119294281 [Triticum dicoccoides]